MKKQMIGSVTSYLADLTTKLTHFVKNQNNYSLDKLNLANKDHEIMSEGKILYTKPDDWNYLKYFDHMLNLDTSHPIRLQKSTQLFTLKEDLFILVRVSSNQHKIVVKSLEQLSKDQKVYKPNFRNIFIRRKFNRLKERYSFLSKYIKEPQLKHLTSWLQIHGLETKAYFQLSSLQQYQKTGSSLSISKSPLSESELIKKKILELTNGKRKRTMKEQQSDSQIDKSDLDNLVEKKSGLKKVHKDVRPICDPHLIFGTPPVKIVPETNTPKAPKKIKQEDNQNEQILQTPNKKRKFVLIIDAKKDVYIKQDSQQQKISQTPTKNSPKVSEFQLYSTEQKIFKEALKSKQNSGEQSLQELKSIVDSFKADEKMSEMRILKILSDVSGNLTDLKTYLKTEDRTLLWKRLEDAVLRKYVKNTDQKTPLLGKKTLTIDRLYEELLKLKGQERVKRRIKYLGLLEDA